MEARLLSSECSRHARASLGHTAGVEPWERERILGEWGVRDGSERERVRRRQLAEELEGSPLLGRPLPQRRRNFRPSVEGYVASRGGPLPWMVRLREIEEAIRGHELALERAWLELAAECADDAVTFGRRWLGTVERWSFSAVNELIEAHNRYFPAESRLPMDPHTGDFALIDGKPYRRAPLDVDWVLERFPAAAARSAA